MKEIKRMLRGLLLGSLVMFAAVSLQAATLTKSLGAGGNLLTNLIAGACKITSITITHDDTATTTNIYFRFIDAPATNLVAGYNLYGRVVGAYTTRVQSAGWVTNFTTNFGTTQWFMSAVYAISTTNYTQAAHTNYWNLIASGYAPTQSVTTVTLPDDGVFVNWGLSLTNLNPLVGWTVTITYFPLL